ncbi:MAG TPA: DUF4426 domain-containing protein [Lysobacter sp.]
MRRIALLAPFALALAACTGSAPPVAATMSAQAAPQQAEARIGDVVVHASAVQTSTLDAAIAKRYGLERSGRTAMLLVGVRRADGSDASGLPVNIEATVSPNGGTPQRVTLREIRVDGLVDRIGTVEIAPPETLRFDVVVRYGDSTSTMRFTRDFFPR